MCLACTYGLYLGSEKCITLRKQVLICRTYQLLLLKSAKHTNGISSITDHIGIVSLFVHSVSVCATSRMFSCTGEEVTRLHFNNGGNYTAALREGSFEIFGDRVTKLGTNM